MGREGPRRDMRETLVYDAPLPGESEDCLYLNVYGPVGGEGDKADMPAPVDLLLAVAGPCRGAVSLPKASEN